MKRTSPTIPLTLAVAITFLSGCASEKRNEAAMAHLGDEAPPDFVVGPTAISLTNFDGFSANVVSTASANSGVRTVSGQLLERQGRFIFQPMTTGKIKNGKFVRGGMFFVWDTEGQRGIVLSEALQGYAPVSIPVRLSGVTPPTGQPVIETANGHPCHRVETKVALSDGSTAKLTEWRADDLQSLPVRIREENGASYVTVDLSDVRFDLPDPNLFFPPAGFTRYASSLSLINELMVREASFSAGGVTGSAQTHSGNWHEPGMPPGGGHP
jgi:hypothetical protein